MGGRVVVGIDGSKASRLALCWAAEEARLRVATLELVTAWERPFEIRQYSARGPREEEMAQPARSLLEATAADCARHAPAVEIRQLVVEGEAAAVLTERATGADLLVVGSRHHNALASIFHGSVSAKCAHLSPSSVVIVPARQGPAAEHHPLGRILVGVDGSAGSMAALRWAAEEAVRRKASLTALSVWRGIDANDEMALEFATFSSLPRREEGDLERAGDELKAALAAVQSRDVQAEGLLLEGEPAETLCREAASYDLLVVGSRGLGAATSLLLGSVSARCAHRSPRPVAIVRPRRGSEQLQP